MASKVVGSSATGYPDAAEKALLVSLHVQQGLTLREVVDANKHWPLSTQTLSTWCKRVREGKSLGKADGRPEKLSPASILIPVRADGLIPGR